MSDQQPVFQIQRVYLKEASLEQPNSPEIMLSQEQPSIDLQIGVNSAQIVDGIYEVCVTATVHAKIKEKTVFLVEARQAGIFELRNMDADGVEQILGIACPQMVYPYLRGNVADLTQRGGFPPVHMTELPHDVRAAQAARGRWQSIAPVNSSLLGL